MLFDGGDGLVNKALVNWVPFISEAPFNVFSWWGIVFVQLMTGTIAVKVMVLAPAFRRIDPALEEASKTLGVSTTMTYLKVIAPALLPAIVVVTLLGAIRSLDAFEIEMVLGSRDGIDIHSTIIYQEVQSLRYGSATAMAMLFVMLLAPLVVLQRWIAARQQQQQGMLSGAYQAPAQDLGRYKWPVFGVIAAAVLSMTAIPVLLVVLSTFVRLFGSSSGDGALTLANWSEFATDGDTLRALRNSVVLGVGSAVVAMTTFTFIAYTVVRTKYFGGTAFDFLSWLPATVPGIVLSIGFLWMFLQIGPLRDLVSGTMLALIIAVAIGGITLGVQIMKSSMLRLGPEVEEASWASGVSPIRTFRNIVLPLVGPSVLVVGILTFATAVRATSIVALLVTDDSNKPLSLSQLDLMVNGQFSEAAVIGVFMVILIVGAALVGRSFGLNSGFIGTTDSSSRTQR